MAGKDDFTIETKLKISGVEAVGKLDAGTLRFDVDTSALQKLVQDAARAAERVKKRFDNIKLKKINVELNQNSLRSMESQIKQAVQNAVGKLKIDIDTSASAKGTGDPFKDQRQSAARSAASLAKMHDLTKQVNSGLRSLINTLSKFDALKMSAGAGMAAGGGAGSAIAALPLPASARVTNVEGVMAEISAVKQLDSIYGSLTSTQLTGISRVQDAQVMADRERMARLQKLQSDLDALYSKEQRLVSQLAGAGGGVFGGGTGGKVPPGGFGSFPPGGGGDPSDIQKFAASIREVTKETERAKKGMEELDELSFLVGRKAAAFRGVAIAINSIVAAVENSVKFMIDFSDALLELNKILQFSESGLQRVGDRLFKLSAETGVAVDETLAIAQEFARAGLEGRGYGSVVDLTEQALRGLQGTTLDASQSSQILIQVIQQIESGARGLNKELITSGKLFDILGRVEDITASKAQDFAEAFKRSGASLVGTGASIEEIAGLLSVVQERTQRGGEVIGTAFKTIATRVSNTSSEAAQALKSIGVSVVDSSGKLRNISDILRDTSTAFEGLTEAEQANIATKVAGLRQIEIFRNTVTDFSRVLDVQRQATLAEGDAARKQALEQQKLGTIIERIKIGFQDLVKTFSEGVFGKVFTVAVQGAELFIDALNAVNKALGGALTNLAGITLGIGAVKILSGLFSGMVKTVKFFVHSTKEGQAGVEGIGRAAKMTKAQGIDPMNQAFGGSVELIKFMNQQMKTFQIQTELAAVQAERLAKARALASSQMDPIMGGNVDKRASEIMQQQGLQDRINRRRAMKAATEQFGAAEVNRTIQASGGVFSGREAAVAQRRAQIEEAGGRDKFFNQRRTVLGKGDFNSVEKVEKSASKLGRAFQFLDKHTLAVGLTAGVAGSLLDVAARKLDESGHEAASAVATVGSNIAQFAGLGSLFGPWGIAIGGVTGLVLGLVDAFKKSEITIQSLQQEYERLGLVQKKAGEITDAAAKMIEVAFKDIKGFQDFQAGQAERKLQEALDPAKAKGRQELIDREFKNLGKNVLASIDLGADRSANIEALRKFLGDMSELTTSSARGGVSFQKEALTAGTAGPLEVSAAQAAESIALLSKTIEAAGGQEGLERFKKALAESSAKLEGGANRLGAEEQVEDLVKIFRSEIPSIFRQVGKEGQVEIDQGARVLGRIARGELNRGSGDFDKEVGALRERIAKGEVKGAGGKTLTVDFFDKLLTRAVQTNETARREQTIAGGGREGLRLADATERGLEILAEIAESNKKQEALASRQQLLLSQRAAIGAIGNTADLSDTAELIKPINSLELTLRKFADEFTKSTLRLEQATIKAITPQKELAAVMARQSKVELDFARKQRELGTGDIRAEFAKAIEELVGGASAEGIDESTGQTRPGFNEEAAKTTRDEVRKSILDGVFAASKEIRSQGIIDPEQQRKVLSDTIQKSFQGSIGTEEFDTLLGAAGNALGKLADLDIEVATATERLAQAELAALQQTIALKERDLEVSSRRRDVLRVEADAVIETFTGLRRLTATRAVESDLQKQAAAEQAKFVDSLDKLIAANRERLAVNDQDVSAQNQLEELTKKRVDAQITLENTLAQEAVAATRARLEALQELINVGSREADFLRTRAAAESDIVNLLRVGGTQLESFNAKLEQNTRQFRITQAQLATEAQLVNATIEDQGEKQARLAEINKRGAEAALEAARAEAEVIAERREAIKQISGELLNNEQEQVQAQKAVIDATKAVSDAFITYREAVRGAAMAATQYNLNLRLAESEGRKVTGAFSGVREELLATQSIFKDAERSLREVGAGEKALVELRRQSINQQLSLFNQLLSEQSSLARNFFQSSTQDQADLFRGIQEAGGVADLLGGSFKQFEQLGERAINDLGSQLLALPQETRQRIVSSLETLKTVGGSVGGFTADQLLTAIETASLGVSGEGLQVDPLFEIQQKIATLTEEQARLATEQLITANEQVKTSRESLDNAIAEKDLAEIQLERIKEEGTQLRGKLAELNGNLQTTLIAADTTNRTGFAAVGAAIQRTTDAITNTLPSALSASFAEALRNALSGSGFGIRGINAMETTMDPRGLEQSASSRGAELARAMREENSNAAEVQQRVNSAGASIGITESALASRAQDTRSNIADPDSLTETNQRLADIASQLSQLNQTTITNSETLTQISEGGGASTPTAAAAVSVPDINVNIQGQQQITVTGFESGVQSIIAGLVQTFGGFVTESEARNIANEVVEAIRLQLERLNIIQRNQL